MLSSRGFTVRFLYRRLFTSPRGEIKQANQPSQRLAIEGNREGSGLKRVGKGCENVSDGVFVAFSAGNVNKSAAAMGPGRGHGNWPNGNGHG
jgi:hypothetical protein